MFLGYFIRSVLQLSDRIEFNKKFERTSSIFRKKLVGEERTESASTEIHAAREQRYPEQQPERSIDPVLQSRELSSSSDPEQSLSPREVHRSSPRDFAVLFARELSEQRRTFRKNKSRKSISGNQRTARKRRSRLVERLEQIQNNPAMRNVPPLTLTNPVSEVLKVRRELFLTTYTGTVQILINFLQVTGLAVAINVDWTRSVRRTLLFLGKPVFQVM